MIDDGATIEADIKGCEPRNDWAKRNEKTAFITEAPLPCREETCYYLTLGKPEISVVNSAIGKKFTLAYEGEALTSFIEWKSMACGDYALGLEPCTSGLDDKFEYKNLAIGDSVRNAVSLTVTKL
jgi:hypothetical protein